MPGQNSAHSPAPEAQDADRPNNRATEYEDLKAAPDGRPPRSASEPDGAEGSSKSPFTATDPISGESQGHPATPKKVGSQEDDAAKRRPG